MPTGIRKALRKVRLHIQTIAIVPFLLLFSTSWMALRTSTEEFRCLWKQHWSSPSRPPLEWKSFSILRRTTLATCRESCCWRTRESNVFPYSFLWCRISSIVVALSTWESRNTDTKCRRSSRAFRLPWIAECINTLFPLVEVLWRIIFFTSAGGNTLRRCPTARLKSFLE